VTGGEKDGARASRAAVEQLLPGVMEVRAHSRTGGELAGAELAALYPVDPAVPRAEIAVGEHAVGKLASKLEQARPARRRGQRRARADRRPAIEKGRRERLKLGPQRVLAALRKVEAGRDGRRNAELGGTAVLRHVEVPRQRGADGRIVPESQAGEIAHAPEIVPQSAKERERTSGSNPAARRHRSF